MISFRLTLEEIPPRMLDWLKECGTTLLVQEHGNRQHYHGFADWHIETYRTKFKREFEGGNKVWSIKKCDTDYVKYLRYICKGSDRDTLPLVIFNVGHNTSELHSEYWLHNVDYINRTAQKNRAHNLIEQIWQDINSELENTLSGRQIAARIFRWYMENNKRLPPGFSMQSMAMTFLARVNDRYEGPDRLSDTDMISRLYPNIQF